jgi:hypothetical protein
VIAAVLVGAVTSLVQAIMITAPLTPDAIHDPAVGWRPRTGSRLWRGRCPPS